jgi:hypothetical protein
MAQTSPGVTITRWRKYGRDRLYVARADGTRLGYWDLVTDEPHPDRPELMVVLESIYLLWAAEFGAADPWTADRLATTSEQSASIA